MRDRREEILCWGQWLQTRNIKDLPTYWCDEFRLNEWHAKDDATEDAKRKRLVLAEAINRAACAEDGGANIFPHKNALGQ